MFDDLGWGRRRNLKGFSSHLKADIERVDFYSIDFVYSKTVN